MRILFLTASLPYPPASGGALRSFGLIHGLYQSGHEVVLLSFHDGGLSPGTTPLAEYCSRIETIPAFHRTKTDRLRDLLFSNQPDIARRLYSPAFEGRLRQLLAEQSFDLIQFEGIEVVCYLPIARQAQPQAKLCFDTFNAEYVLQRLIFEIDRHDLKRWPAALYSLIQSRRIARFEGEMCRQADCVIAVSPEDAEALRNFRADRYVSVVPNGIFVDDYQSVEKSLDLEQDTLVFTGKMDYRPNVDAMIWFAADVLPLVRKTVPDVHLYVVGQKPHPRLDTLRDQPDITITGWVDSVRPYLQAGAVYVAPLRMGSGTRLKILEAMASGCAVVATSTAASGLQSEARQAMIVTDGADDMAAGIIDLLQNPARCQDIGEKARRYVRDRYDWSVLIPKLLAAYGEIGLE